MATRPKKAAQQPMPKITATDSPSPAPAVEQPPEPAPSPSATPLYDAAMKARSAGTLRRATLTEKGWVTPAESKH